MASGATRLLPRVVEEGGDLGKTAPPSLAQLPNLLPKDWPGDDCADILAVLAVLAVSLKRKRTGKASFQDFISQG